MYEYIAFGDSITAGFGLSSRYCAYPWLIKSRLTQQLAAPVGLKVVARNGWTSQALLNSLFSQDPERIRRAQTITILIGGDDLVKAGKAILKGRSPELMITTLASYKQNLIAIICGIKQISRARIILCTQYNPFPQSPLAVANIQSFNQITAGISSAYSTEIATVHRAYVGREAQLIQDYNGGRMEDAFNSPLPPIHPNYEGQRVAADVIYPRF